MDSRLRTHRETAVGR